MQTSAKSGDQPQNGRCFRVDDGFNQELLGRVQNHCRNRCLVNVQPNMLSVIYDKVRHSVGIEANNQNLLQWGALL
jgi:hypothetical protein